MVEVLETKADEMVVTSKHACNKFGSFLGTINCRWSSVSYLSPRGTEYLSVMCCHCNPHLSRIYPGISLFLTQTIVGSRVTCSMCCWLNLDGNSDVH